MMDGRREDDLSAIAWPGFVDILSAVIIMFVFFVMITAVALYAHTITYKSKVLQEAIEQVSKATEKASDHEATKHNEALSEKNKELEKTVDEMNRRNKALEDVISEYEQQLFQIHTEFEESAEQSTLSEAPQQIVIFFGKDSITLTEETQGEVISFVNNALGGRQLGEIKVKIVAGKTPNTAIESIARKVAVARIFNARNVLIDLDIPPENISATLDQEEVIQDSHHWVRLVISYEE